jgi:hypothetical protein
LSEIVNLRLARKRKTREMAELRAAERRAQFGRKTSETQAEADRRERDARALDGHRLSRPDEP